MNRAVAVLVTPDGPAEGAFGVEIPGSGGGGELEEKLAELILGGEGADELTHWRRPVVQPP